MNNTPPKRIWAIEYSGEAVPRSGEWVAEEAEVPERAVSYTLTSEADAMVAAALREAAAYHDAEIARLERQIEANNEYLLRWHGEAGAHYLTSEANNACRSHITHHQLSVDTILRLIPQPANAALDKLIAEAEARGMERAETHIAAIERLAISASIASCTCLAKTPDITLHAADCRYVHLQYIIAQCEDFRAQLAEAQKREARYQEALIWCSGSEDFQTDGQARAGWLKLCAPLIDRAALTS